MCSRWGYWFWASALAAVYIAAGLQANEPLSGSPEEEATQLPESGPGEKGQQLEKETEYV